VYQLQVKHHFVAPVAPGSIHCGLDDDPAPRVYHYQVDIEADGLDAYGFVVDNMDVVNYFNRIEAVGVSCEELCRLAAHELWDERFTRIEVRIHGTTFASVSCCKVREPAAAA
jgi:hypothetical protein